MRGDGVSVAARGSDVDPPTRTRCQQTASACTGPCASSGGERGIAAAAAAESGACDGEELVNGKEDNMLRPRRKDDDV